VILILAIYNEVLAQIFQAMLDFYFKMGCDHYLPTLQQFMFITLPFPYFPVRLARHLTDLNVFAITFPGMVQV
jgi:hypothetical protein